MKYYKNECTTSVTFVACKTSYYYLHIKLFKKLQRFVCSVRCNYLLLRLCIVLLTVLLISENQSKIRNEVPLPKCDNSLVVRITQAYYTAITCIILDKQF